MKKSMVIILVMFLNFSNGIAQEGLVKQAFLEKLQHSKAYLIAIAEAMPELEYDFKPTERQRSFKEQLIHIKENMEWLSNSYFTENEFKRKKTINPDTKSETIELLEIAFDSVYKIVENTPEEDLKTSVDFFAGAKSKLQILNLLQDHVSHHRGQLIVYLNLKYIKPPKYIGW